MNRKELVEQIFAKKSFLCVGLDTDINKLPKCITESEDIQGAEAEMIFRFNKAIIDATAPYCVAYKPNLAFYESRGIDGMIAFENTIKYLHSHYPNHFIIADAKRGDIGNTSKMYAQTFFEEYNIDSVTVAPYMGEDSVKPFLEYDGKWVIPVVIVSGIEVPVAPDVADEPPQPAMAATMPPARMAATAALTLALILTIEISSSLRMCHHASNSTTVDVDNRPGRPDHQSAAPPFRG